MKTSFCALRFSLSPEISVAVRKQIGVPMFRLLTAVLLLATVRETNAQVLLPRPQVSPAIAGIVRDSNRVPIEGASVRITGSPLRDPINTVTNGQGHFFAAVPAAGIYSVRVQRIGFAAQVVSVSSEVETTRIVEIEIGGETISRVAEAPNLPLLQPFADAENWVLHTDLIYRVGETKDSIVVPAGFVTDFASIPKSLQSLFSVNGPYLVAGIIHDYLYWEQGAGGCTRAEADGIFRLAMIENQATRFEWGAMYAAVDLAGGGPWNDNAGDRRNGLVRQLPIDRRTIRPLTKWPEFRRALFLAGLRPPPPVPISRAFCVHGTQDPRSVIKGLN